MTNFQRRLAAQTLSGICYGMAIVAWWHGLGCEVSWIVAATGWQSFDWSISQMPDAQP